MKFSYEQVCEFLSEMKKAIEDDNYTVSPREKNKELFQKYLLKEKDREKILLSLTAEDCCDIKESDKEKYEGHLLYIFGKEKVLIDRYSGEEEKVQLYIKVDKVDDEYFFVISFHEQEHPLKPVFV